MVLKLYNTLTRKQQVFKPVNKNLVRMYVCGPTVNDVPHLGHARQQITFDVLRKYLIFSEYKVKFVSNITDIEDKIINKAKELNEDIKTLTERNLKAHLEDYSRINVDKPDVQPHATQYIKEMINLIERLEKKGYTYEIEGDGVYYDVSKFKDYGKLSHQNIENLKTNARKKLSEGKRNKEDFVLWKFSKPDEPKWESPWGIGRPGWHIECSAMSESILGLPLDIHGGGQDLIFPHHEDEIAQSESAFGKKFANYWVHNGLVNVDRIKMSKSLGNFRTIRDILKNYSGEIIRFFVISAHYRKPVDFSENTLENAKNGYERLKRITEEIKDDLKKENKEYLKEFKNAMDDDLNTPKALQVLWKLVRDEKAIGKIKTIEKIDSVFGLNLLKPKKTSFFWSRKSERIEDFLGKEEIKIPAEILGLIDERENARKKKDWKLADKFREKIKEKGFNIDDTGDGVKVNKI
ncbi:cysteine--tRNA ligase [Candidatus Pacearchaeota archaeon]|nr:cysteine--tRNA ligase [Candidatus Pacearchaeota archaeon]